MRWAYLPEWDAWWLLLDDGGPMRGYGPFNETEAEWAGDVHGVPFTATPVVTLAAQPSGRPLG